MDAWYAALAFCSEDLADFQSRLQVNLLRIRDTSIHTFKQVQGKSLLEIVSCLAQTSRYCSFPNAVATTHQLPAISFLRRAIPSMHHSAVLAPLNQHQLQCALLHLTQICITDQAIGSCGRLETM